MEEKSIDYMNVIPLVDVMMVLLVIVLMTSTFIASGMIHVDLPKAAQDQKLAAKTMTIVIDADGIIYFNSRPTTVSGLAVGIREIRRDTPILVRADRRLTVQVCVDVLDILSNNGFTKIALQTDRQL